MKTLTTKEHTELHADKVAGYRQLSDEEIAAVNTLKKAGAELDVLLTFLESTTELNVDHEWLRQGKHDLQTGLMKCVRAVARPEGF